MRRKGSRRRSKVEVPEERVKSSGQAVKRSRGHCLHYRSTPHAEVD